MQQLALRISIRWWSKDAENQKRTEIFMPNGDLNWIANFIWGIADDVLVRWTPVDKLVDSQRIH
jgi:hypothetical protein